MPPKSTPGDGSRSTWGDPKTALPPLLGETSRPHWLPNPGGLLMHSPPKIGGLGGRSSTFARGLMAGMRFGSWATTKFLKTHQQVEA